MIKFRCSSCNQKLGVDDKYAGRRVRCNKCKEPAQVPHPDPRPVVAIETPSPKVTTPVLAEKNTNTLQSEQTNLFEGLDLDSGDDDAQRLEAIQMARLDRVAQKSKAVKYSAKKPGKNKAKDFTRPRKEGFSMPSFADMVPPVIAFPLSLAASVLAMGAVIGIWIVAARSAEAGLNFFGFLVPIAGALGLRLFMVNRTIVLGLLGLIIGLAGIGVAKVAISKYVVRDYYQKTSKEEILVNLKEILADSAANIKNQPRTIKPYAIDGTYQLCTGLISLVDDGQADPIKTQAGIIQILRRPDNTNFFKQLMGETPARSKPPVEVEIESEILSKARTRIIEWDGEKLLFQKTKKYFPVLQKLITQYNYRIILEDPESSFRFCLVQSFGLLDVFWIFLGMTLTYITLSFD